MYCPAVAGDVFQETGDPLPMQQRDGPEARFEHLRQENAEIVFFGQVEPLLRIAQVEKKGLHSGSIRVNARFLEERDDTVEGPHPREGSEAITALILEIHRHIREKLIRLVGFVMIGPVFT